MQDHRRNALTLARWVCSLPAPPAYLDFDTGLAELLSEA